MTDITAGSGCCLHCRLELPRDGDQGIHQELTLNKWEDSVQTYLMKTLQTMLFLWKYLYDDSMKIFFSKPSMLDFVLYYINPWYFNAVKMDLLIILYKEIFMTQSNKSCQTHKVYQESKSECLGDYFTQCQWGEGWKEESRPFLSTDLPRSQSTWGIAPQEI